MRVAFGMHVGNTDAWTPARVDGFAFPKMLPSLQCDVQDVSQRAPSSPTPHGTTAASGGRRCSDKPVIRRNARDTPSLPVSRTVCLCRPVLCCQPLIGRPATAPRSNPKPVISQAPPPTGKRSRSREPGAACLPGLPQTGPFCTGGAESWRSLRCRHDVPVVLL